MNLNKIYILFIILFGSSWLIAQEPFLPKNEAIENLIEYLSQNDEEQMDFEEYSTRLSFLYDHPINLNTCKDEELASLNVFSVVQIMSIIEYRNINNGFASLYELKLVEGISNEQIFLSVPFLKTSKAEKYSPSINLKNLAKMGKQSVMLRYQRVIQQQSAYIPDSEGKTDYLGTPDRVFVRYKYQFTNKIRAGITADKDAGELFFKSPNQNGFDFYSGFIQLQNQGIVKSLVLGDYALQFGQGLALWNGFGMGKSMMTTNVSRFGKGVSKYSSTDENNFFRGVATTLQLKKFELSIFYSSKKTDGHISSDTLDNDIDRFTSFDNTGLHATESQLAKKKTIGETIYGANLDYRFNRLKLGLTYLTYKYSHALLPSGKLYKIYDFSGTENQNTSLHYQWNLNQIYFSGEVAVDKNLNVAVTNNAVFNISSKLGFALLHRYFDKKYQALYADAFSEGSHIQNEQGFYTGINFFPTKNWIIKAYVDFYKFPWLRYQVSKPSTGLDYFILAEYALSSNFNFYLRFKDETKLKDISVEAEPLKQQKEVNNKQFRIHFNYGDRGAFHFKTRLQWSWYEHVGKEKGFLAYQDIVYVWNRIPLKSTFRFLIFDTDGYNSRIYTYENDLLYNYAIPSFANRGIRSYILLKYDLMKNLTFWIKYGITIYSDKSTISSGYTEIQGNKKSEIKLQLRWKF